jgi:hypothetical protein
MDLLMTQPEVTTADVLTTIKECDHLGRHKFLTKYGYGEAHSLYRAKLDAGC